MSDWERAEEVRATYDAERRLPTGAVRSSMTAWAFHAALHNTIADVVVIHREWCDRCHNGPGERRVMDEDGEQVDCPECHAWADEVADAVLDAVKG